MAAARGLRVPDDARRLWHVHARDRSQHPVGIAFEQAHVVAREVGDGQKAPVGRQREVPRPLPSGRNVAAPRNPSLAVHREDDQLVASAHRRVQLSLIHIWDEALDEIAGKIKSIQTEFGESAVAFLTASGNQSCAITSA